MILGVGIDLVDIRRIEKSFQKFGQKFSNKVFTPLERERSEHRADRFASYARRFAAKEACVKALGTGMYRESIGWKDISVINDSLGAPRLHLEGAAAKKLQDMTPKGAQITLSVSITDEYPYAQAIVIISFSQKI